MMPTVALVYVATFLTAAFGEIYHVSSSLGDLKVNKCHGLRCPNMRAAAESSRGLPASQEYAAFIFDPGTHAINVSAGSVHLKSSTVHVMSNGRDTTIKCIQSAGKNVPALEAQTSQHIYIENVTFVECGVPVINAPNAASFSIVKSTFSSNSAVVLHNVVSTVIRDSVFQKERSGVQLTYTNTTTQMSLEIASSNFTDLTAEKDGNQIGYGAGVNLVMTNASDQISVKVSDTVFSNNRANTGGAFYILADSSRHIDIQIEHNVSFVNCAANFTDIHDASVEGNGGAVAIMILGNDFNSGKIRIHETLFQSNMAIHGSAIFIVYSGNGPTVSIDNSSFKENVGMIHGAVTVYNVSGQRHPVIIKNSKFLKNSIKNIVINKKERSDRGSGLALVGTTALIDGDQNVFRENNNSAVALFTSWLRLEGSVEFSKNKGTEGAAIFIGEGSAIQAYDSSTAVFVGNAAAKEGGAIAALNYATETLLSPLLKNRLCFIRPYPEVGAVMQANFTFDGNTAKSSGHDVYADFLKVCGWTDLGGFSVEKVLIGSESWPHFYYSSNGPNRLGSRHHGVSVTATLSSVLPFPPERKIQPTCNNTGRWHCFVYSGVAYSLVVTTNASRVIVRGKYGLWLSRYYDQISNGTWFKQYEISFETKNITEYIYFSGQMDNVSRAMELEIATDYGGTSYFTIHMPISCAMAHMQIGEENGTHGCKCHNTTWLNHHMILSCDWRGCILPYPGFWIGQVNSSNSTVSGWCPERYCSCNTSKGCWFDVREPDQQCSDGRSGELCGSCSKTNYSVSFGLFYIECKNQSSCWKVPIRVVIPAMILMSFVIVFLAIVIDFDATKGFAAPLIFFFQVVAFTLSTEPNYGLLTETLVRYASSLPNLNIPFPWCLLENATALESITLLYVMPVSVFLFMIIFGFVARRMARVARIHVIRPFWSLITLTYVGITYTTMLLLHCVPLGGVDGSSRWYLDATNTCFHEPHLYYAIGALFVCVVYVLPFPFFVAFGMRRIHRFHAITDVALHAYEPKFYWAEGWNFGRRLLLVMVHCFASIQGENFRQTLVLMLLVLFFAIHGQLQMYKGVWLNSLETALLTILCFLTACQVFSYNPPLPIQFAEVLFWTPYVGAGIYIIYLLYVKIARYRKKRKGRNGEGRDEGGASASVRFDKRRSRTFIEMPSKSDEFVANLAERSSASLPRSFDQDVLMDDSLKGLREPLLELPTDKCQNDGPDPTDKCQHD